MLSISRPGPDAERCRFAWRRSTGAAFYTIERSESAKGPWKVITTGLEVPVLADVVKFVSSAEASEPMILFYDESKTKEKNYFYRLKGEKYDWQFRLFQGFGNRKIISGS